jgi:hypothetical protein
MGRPIKKSFFANLNAPYQNHATGGTTGQGGEGVASVALGTAGSGYSQGVTLTASAPNLGGGITATFSVEVSTSTGAIVGYTVVNAGSGYTTVPVVTLGVPDAVSVEMSGQSGELTMTGTNVTGIFVGMEISGTGPGTSGLVQSITGPVGGVYTVTSNVANDSTFTGATITFTDIGSAAVPGTVALTNIAQNGLAVTAFVAGGSSGIISDIMKQQSSRRYLVINSQGRGTCKLVAKSSGSLVAGEMTLIATDSDGGTYYVTKLTARRALLVPIDGTQFAANTTAGWNLTLAQAGVSVVVANV